MVVQVYQIGDQRFKESIQKQRLEKFVNKSQHGVYFLQIKDNDINTKSSLLWLEKCHVSPQTVAYICGAQKLAIFTFWHEWHLFKNRDDDTCRVCRKETETTVHILAGGNILAKTRTLEQHNSVAKYIHYEICKAYDIHI